MSLDTDYWNSGAGTPPTDYTQTAVLQTSQQLAVPAGTKRIFAMLCGGGDGGSSDRGGAFGGLIVAEIPVLGAPLDIVIGLGGTPGNLGGTTSISINGEIHAAIGPGYPYRFTPTGVARGMRTTRWAALREDGGNGAGATADTSNLYAGVGAGARGTGNEPSAGGSTTSIPTNWGRSGFSGGTSAVGHGGGGGGMLAAGTNASASVGGAGGNGGGGGGRGTTTPGAGGNGFAIVRFYK